MRDVTITLADGQHIAGGYDPELITDRKAYFARELGVPQSQITGIADGHPEPATPAPDIAAIARNACRQRIEAVADLTAQVNMAAAASSGLFDEPTMAVWRAGVQWVAAMRARWPEVVAEDMDPSVDANWPACPPEVMALAEQF